MLKKQKPQTVKEKAQKIYEAGLSSIKDIIAPAAFVVSPNNLLLNKKYVRTFFVLTYPQYVDTNWLSPIINFDIEMDIGMFIYPEDSSQILKILRRKVVEMESSLRLNAERGAVRDPGLEAAYQDAEELRDKLQRGIEKFFRFALYFTIYADSLKDLDEYGSQLEAALGQRLIYTKPALLQMEQGYNSTLPLADDSLGILRNMTSSSAATAFPFVSSDLSTNDGILYGINRNNNSLIIFDRFKLENANMAVFAKSGAGKSYAVKLEVLRSLMQGIDVFVIDPENEYKALARAVGGSYLDISLNSEKRINPFDLPYLGEEAKGENVLRAAIIAVSGLMNLMLGKLNPEESAIIDKAIMEAYSLKDITADRATQKNPPPTMQDLYEVLKNTKGAESLAQRLSKYTEGTFAGIFNRPTNFDLDRGLVAFNIRDLEEELRPIGMYVILSYIWNRIRFEKRKRLMVVDEAWILMQYEDSAKFMYSIAKRARKYWLGLTVITQDVDDFLGNKYGKAVVANSSLQILMKQSPSSINTVTDVFKLTQGEKFLLLEADVGEGLFFAGTNHAAIKVVASFIEDRIVTSDPKQLAELAKTVKEQ